MFLQTLFAVGQSCPKPALSWDTAMLHMDVRIDKSKLALIHHFKNLDNTSLAKRIYEENRNYSWPGLVSECVDILCFGTKFNYPL